MADIKDLVLKERDKGNVVLMTPGGLEVRALKGFAVALVVRELKDEVERLKNKTK